MKDESTVVDLTRDAYHSEKSRTLFEKIAKITNVNNKKSQIRKRKPKIT